MKKMFTNPVCGFRLSCLSALFCLLLLPAAYCPAQEAERLTLARALVLCLENGADAPLIAAEEQRLAYWGAELGERSIKHETTAALTNSRNEVADSQDLVSASATENQQLKLGYKQVFESGFYWSFTHTRRASKTFEEEEEDEETEFSKSLLSANYPLYGKAAAGSALANEKEAILLGIGEIELRKSKVAQQTQTAAAFFKLVLARKEWENAGRHARIVKKKLERKRASPSRNTPLDMRQLELQALQLEQEELVRKLRYRQAYQNLGFMIGVEEFEIVENPVEPPPLDFGEEAPEEAYLRNSVKLRSLTSQRRIKEKNLEQSRLAAAPSVYASGYAGQSQNGTSTGTNTGLGLHVSYKFGGGQSERVSRDEMEIAKLDVKIAQLQRALSLEARQDLQRLDFLNESARIREKLRRLALEQFSLSETRYRAGRLVRDDLIKSEIAAVKAETAAVRHRTEVWLHYLQILEKNQADLLPMLVPPNPEKPESPPTRQDDGKNRAPGG